METSSQARPFARPDLRAGLFGLDPRTHLLAVVAFGVASIVLTGLLETALLQVAAALYLAGNGRARLALRSCASFAVVAGLSFLPLPGLYGVLFVSLLHMVPPFTAGCALFSLSPSAIMCALARWRVPQRVLVGVCMLFRFASVLSFSAENAISSPTVPMKNWLRGSCITTPRRSVRSRGASRRTSAPHTSTTPVRSPGKNVPANPSTRRNTVDLPSPERPHSTRQRPGATDSDTSSTRLPDAGAAEPASASNPRSDSST